MDYRTESQAEESANAVVLRLNNLKQFIQILTAIRGTIKQQCCMIIFDERGLTMKWDDESKALQSSVTLKSQVFETYEFNPPTKRSGLLYQIWLDALNVFASSTEQAQIQYPGPRGGLVVEQLDRSRGVQSSMYATVDCTEPPQLADLHQHWQEPSNSFQIKGILLKEVVEDLEWPNADVSISLLQSPDRVHFVCSGTGSLKIELPVSEVHKLIIHEQTEYSYKYKHMKQCFCCLGKEYKELLRVATKIEIDVNGIMKVTHTVPLSSTQGGGGGGSASTQTNFEAATFPGSQRIAQGQYGTVQYMVLPVDNLY